MAPSRTTLFAVRVSKLIQHHLIHVTPAPIFAGFKGLDDGVQGRVKMFGGVLVLGSVAASDVSAGKAQSQMDPVVTQLQTFFASVAAGLDVMDLPGVCANPCHGYFLKCAALRRCGAVHFHNKVSAPKQNSSTGYAVSALTDGMLSRG
jgi:hypothetical protein